MRPFKFGYSTFKVQHTELSELWQRAKLAYAYEWIVPNVWWFINVYIYTQFKRIGFL